jgi:trimethylamine--corrinoid protein Co-methyltransferase
MAGIYINDRSFTSVQFARLSPEQCQKIHNASLEILDRTGARLFNQEAITLLKQAGAFVSDGNLVRIPAGMVEEALSTVPKRLTLYDQKGKPSIFLANTRCYFGTGSDCLNIIDHRTGQRRAAVLNDVVEGIRLCDALPNVDFVMSMFHPSDVNPLNSDRYQMEAIITNTDKPVVFVTHDLAGCIDAVKMAEAVAGEIQSLSRKPFITCYINVATALRHNAEALQKLLYLAEKRLPVTYIPVTSAGATGPVTPAGTVSLNTAGMLVGLVLSQLKCEGVPFIAPGMGVGAMDMKHMTHPYFEPNFRCMATAMARFYELPSFGIGGISDSLALDHQAAAEAAISIFYETLSGANLIHDLGFIEQGLTGSFVQLVICDEIIEFMKHFTTSLEITDENLALDLIDEVGTDGQFLTCEHTFKHFRKLWSPSLFERNNYSSWEQNGSKHLIQRATEKIDRIFAEHESKTLPERIAKRLKVIVKQSANDQKEIN